MSEVAESYSSDVEYESDNFLSDSESEDSSEDGAGRGNSLISPVI